MLSMFILSKVKQLPVGNSLSLCASVTTQIRLFECCLKSNYTGLLLIKKRSMFAWISFLLQLNFDPYLFLLLTLQSIYCLAITCTYILPFMCDHIARCDICMQPVMRCAVCMLWQHTWKDVTFPFALQLWGCTIYRVSIDIACKCACWRVSPLGIKKVFSNHSCYNFVAAWYKRNTRTVLIFHDLSTREVFEITYFTLI